MPTHLQTESEEDFPTEGGCRGHPPPLWAGQATCRPASARVPTPAVCGGSGGHLPVTFYVKLSELGPRQQVKIHARGVFCL